MKITFERPDYCEGCLAAELHIKTTKMYCEGSIDDLGNIVYSSEPELVCEHDKACIDLHRRLVDKYFAKRKEEK